MRLLRLFMSLCKARIIRLQRGYLTGYEPNLRSNRVLWRAAINHPVKVVKVLFELHRIVLCDVYLPRDPAQQLGPRGATFANVMRASTHANE
jgi:hypothetical protein